jgi:co-chaperonin GroES (HSP10)
MKFKPTFNRVQVEKYELKEVRTGLIQVSDERNPFGVAKIVAIGPMAFKREEGKVTHDVNIGDLVVYEKGKLATISLGAYQIYVMNDDAITGKYEG